MSEVELRKPTKRRKDMMLTANQIIEFDKVVRPVLQFLNSNCHPHTQVIITPTRAELTEGICSTGEILDYVKD